MKGVQRQPRRDGRAGKGLWGWLCPTVSPGPTFPCTPTSQPFPADTPFKQSCLSLSPASPWLFNSSLREMPNKTTTKTQSRLAVARSWVEWGVTTRGYEVSFKGDENVIKLDYSDGCTTLNILKCIELYAFHRRMLWYVNYTSIKLLKKPEHTHKISTKNHRAMCCLLLISRLLTKVLQGP